MSNPVLADLKVVEPTSKKDIIIATIKKNKFIVMGFIGMFVLLIIIGMASGGGNKTPTPGPPTYGPPMMFQYPQYGPPMGPQYGPYFGPQPGGVQ